MDRPTRVTRSQQALLDVISELEGRGFEPAGHTATQSVRVPTSRSPIYGSSGGELRTFGGRSRFWKPGTDFFATVGKRTTCVYRSTASQLAGAADASNTFDTKNLAALKTLLDRLGFRTSAT